MRTFTITENGTPLSKLRKTDILDGLRPVEVADDGMMAGADRYIIGAIAASVVCNGGVGWHHNGVVGMLALALIPLAIYQASETFGKLVKRHLWWLAGTVGGLGLAGLVVSLFHVAEALELATAQPAWQCWSLAIIIDGLLVAMKAVKVLAK